MGDAVNLVVGRLLERAAVVARVEQDDLHAAAGRTEDRCRVDAFLSSPRIVRTGAEEVEEQLLRLILEREIAAGVVLAQVVIVPRRQDRAGGPQLLEARQLAERAVLFLDYRWRHLASFIQVRVDVVAHEQEQLRLGRRDCVEDRHRLVLIGTGTEGNPREHPGRFVGPGSRGENENRQGKRGTEHGELPRIECITWRAGSVSDRSPDHSGRLRSRLAMDTHQHRNQTLHEARFKEIACVLPFSRCCFSHRPPWPPSRRSSRCSSSGARPGISRPPASRLFNRFSPLAASISLTPIKSPISTRRTSRTMTAWPSTPITPASPRSRKRRSSISSRPARASFRSTVRATASSTPRHTSNWSAPSSAATAPAPFARRMSNPIIRS